MKRGFGLFGAQSAYELDIQDVVWTLGTISSLNRQPFDADLLIRELPAAPLTTDSLVAAAKQLGFRTKRLAHKRFKAERVVCPCVALVRPAILQGEQDVTLAHADQIAEPVLLAQAAEGKILLFRAGQSQPETLSEAQFREEHLGVVYQFLPIAKPVDDPDGSPRTPAFGFRWFIPELLKHRRVWRDVLIASLFIQLLALGMPLFTQVVIDKVVVHRTQSTLVVVATGMAIFTLFTALLTWVRQYLVLHTGNRVDAVLGSEVFSHLLKLPPRYFESRPTGVITARLRGVENIREFIASAAVTLVLDVPFLAIFVAIMFFYSVSLTAMTLGIVGLVILLSLAVAPVFRRRLNDQFIIGARNQAFATEYIAGLETVKSLQMESHVKSRYDEYLADYLRSGFVVRQVANTYNVVANILEQTMNLGILVVGALYVMSGDAFTIGMLVAFQMFAGRVSQPMLRLVGLWQQFQQANLSVARLGDIMNAPSEPYSLKPARSRQGSALIRMEALGFRYAPNLPVVFQGLQLEIAPGRVVAIMGPSGSGKSTLAKLLQGMYQPSEGRITIDGADVAHLSANELRSYFGVVPQETMLFSGSILDNLKAGNIHAPFERISQACRIAEIHEIIERLPDGYNTLIGERGVGLSGGQKQRLAIARALIKEPKVLIFDEATSSLDIATAEHFCSTINQLRGRVSMLFITHALPKTLQIDEIVQIGTSGAASTKLSGAAIRSVMP